MQRKNIIFVNQVDETFMKLLNYILIFSFAALVSCRKPPAPDNPVIEPVPDHSTVTPLIPLVFDRIETNDTIVKVQAKARITAIASGDSITFAWTSEATLIPVNDTSVLFTICHEDRFKVTCVVTDRYDNSISKSIWMVAKALHE